MTNPTTHLAEVLQTADTAALAAVARGEIDLRDLVLAELAARGVDHAGRWVGFPRAAAIADEARRQARSPARRRAAIPEGLAMSIARELGFETLEVRNHDRLDFREVSVGGLRGALNRAYRRA